jgi:hypothetical protein
MNKGKKKKVNWEILRKKGENEGNTESNASKQIKVGEIIQITSNFF